MSDAKGSLPLMRYIWIILGPLLALVMLLSPVPQGLTPEAWKVCIVAIWMAIWWITEAMPLPVTSLLPIIILPTFQVITLKQTLEPFSSSIIYLFLGGFILSTAMQKWNLHLRIALNILRLFGSGAKAILAAFMLVTCFLAMWISNTATAIMMLPMALSIGALLNGCEEGDKKDNKLAKALVLGIAYSSVIGGLGTFIGTPTNAILQGHIEKIYGFKLSLADWMMFGIPVVLVMFAISWSLLSTTFLKGYKNVGNAKDIIAQEYASLGCLSGGEKIVAIVFAVTVGLWVFGGLLEDAMGIKLDDAVIAVFGAALLFVIPTSLKEGTSPLVWKDTEKMPWGVLIFFGGSLSISSALTQTGVTLWLSHMLESLGGVDAIIIISVVVALIIIVSEMMSNVATITAFLPILSALSSAIDINPLLVLVPATMAASCGFMLPGASAPNALAYSTGHIKVSDMTRLGVILDILAMIVIVGASYTIVMMVLNIQLGVIPEWAKIK